jgi:hypothetical protein
MSATSARAGLDDDIATVAVLVLIMAALQDARQAPGQRAALM